MLTVSSLLPIPNAFLAKQVYIPISSLVIYSIVSDGLSSVTPSTPGSPSNNEVIVPFEDFCQYTSVCVGDEMTLQFSVTLLPYSTVSFDESTVTIGLPF